MLLAATTAGTGLTFTGHWTGWLAIGIFVCAYLLVMAEEKLKLRKSKPVILAAGLIWALIGIAYALHGDTATAGSALRHTLAEYAELFLFVLVAMTYVNTMEERQVFDALRAWLVRLRLNLRAVFWATGLLAFFLSSLLDNLTTALVMGTVAITVGRGYPKFIALACINVVVAANAGGAFSPFGDITTLMVWQAGRATFWQFLALFVPSVVNWVVPAFFMSFAVEKAQPEVVGETLPIRRGGLVIVGLFGVTVATAVMFYNVLKLPPVLGMTTGLGMLQLYSYYLQRSRPMLTPVQAAGVAHTADVGADEREEVEIMRERRREAQAQQVAAAHGGSFRLEHGSSTGLAVSDLAIPFTLDPPTGEKRHATVASSDYDGEFDIFDILRRAEWDTLMFFYGIILCVGGLAQLGYLAGLSGLLYGDFGPTIANIAVGVISSVVDNIPVMYAVLNMNPAMDLSQWLLVTLTAGVGGSMLSIGSAAGVALMGQSRGVYTFLSHLRWTWAIALGYAASIAVHLLINH